MLVFQTKSLSLLMYVVSICCFMSPVLAANDGAGEGGEASLWDIKALTSYSSLYEPELRVISEEVLMAQGISLSPQENEVLVFSQQRKIAILSKPLLSEGQFLYRENAGICWAINKPFPATLVLTNNAIIQKSEDGSEQVIDGSKSPVIAELTELFASIFTGDSKQILSAFDVYMLQRKPSLMPKAGWMLGMRPKVDSMVGIPKEIRLLGEGHLRWVWFLNRSGDQTLIEFSAVEGLQSEKVITRCFGRT